MKQCSGCMAMVAADGFYVSNRSKCKECVRADAREYLKSHAEERKAYDLLRRSDPRRVEMVRQYDRNRRIRNPEKPAARAAVKYAIKTGALTRLPCGKCGTSKKVHAHHSDYSKPLDVDWLCFQCHNQLHHGEI